MKLLIWDFDGTLAYLEGRWSGTLYELLRREEPNLGVTLKTLQVQLQQGFPWHTPELAHPELNDAEMWWNHVALLFEAIFRTLGIPSKRALELSSMVRELYIDSSRWTVYPDTFPTLLALTEKGWRHVILSNHVPELNLLASDLNITPHLEALFNSATTRYEKPHPEAYLNVLRAFPNQKEVYMIGDNLHADVLGAKKVGISGFLVRAKADADVRSFSDLRQLIDFL
jgi:putative hydrolase of the HAD superfamily